MLVPREHLKQFAGKGSTNMLKIVSDDLLTHLDDVPVQSYATDFMKAMLEVKNLDTQVLALILKNARVLKDGMLYRKAVQKAAEEPCSWSSTGKHIGTVIWPPSMNLTHNNTKSQGSRLGHLKKSLPTIAEICNKLSAPQKSDWDEW